MALSLRYRVFIKYCVFPEIFVIFLNSASSAAALVFYLPGVCTHTDTEVKQRKTRVRNVLKSSEKTQYLMNTLYLLFKIKQQQPVSSPEYGKYEKL